MSQFKRKLTAFTAMLAFLSLSGAAMAVTGADVINQTGNVGITGDASRLDVDITSGQNGAVGQVDWNNFNVGAGQHVNFGFSGLSQTIINRVLGGNESQILGKLTNGCVGGGSCTSFAATSKVILINPAGIMFGPGSTVDLNSFTASTHDFRGAKNLGGMTAAELEAYQSGVLNKISPVAGVNGEGRNYGNIHFDSNYTEAFRQAGIEYNPGQTQITLDGTTFAHFDKDGNIVNPNPNKSVAIVSDNIKYKDSLIKTGDNLNYGGKQSFSNVRLVTADGVTFSYLANGYADDYAVDEDSKTDVVRTIDMNNSGLGNNAAIESGDVHIVNKAKAAGSDIKVKNTVVKGTKLVNKENGDIFITGSKDVLVENSRLESVNTTVTKADGTVLSTKDQNGGEVVVLAGKDATVKDSLIITAGAKASAPQGGNPGGAQILASNNVNIDNSKVLADGNIKVKATNDINAKDSLIYTNTVVDKTKVQNIDITGSGDITAHNTAISANGNTTIKSIYSDNSLAGNIVISSDLTEDGKNQSLVAAKDKLSIQGSNTRIDNTGLAYEEVKFYNDGTSGLNNVTIANNTTFTPIKDGAVSPDVALETNGNLTFDNATAKIAGYSLKFDRDANNELIDDGSASAINYKLSFNTANASNLDAKSTQKNVVVTNKSNIVTNENISLTADKGNANVLNSKLKTNTKDVNITATKGSVNIKNNADILAGKDLNVKAHNTITFGAKGASGVNIDNSTKLKAEENMNFTSTAGDINAEKTTMPTVTYGDRLSFNAANNNNFTSENSLKAVNVDFVAGKSNNFATKGDMQFVNSSLKAPKNNITTTQEGGDVIMNNLTIKSATENAKDTVTTIKAKGNVTTKDVTGTADSDVAAEYKTFPQSVNFEGSVTGDDKDTVLDVNKTKLVVNTQVNKTTPKNNDDGSITLTVKNADNRDAGVDLVAKNDSWDGQIGKGEGPEVHLHAQDGKVSISNIYTDKLTLSKSNKFIAATDTPDGMPTITVLDQGGFNLDPNKGYDPTPDGFTYDKNITDHTETSDTVRIWDEEKGEYVISETDNETTYGKDYVDRTTITTTDREHEIHFGENGEEEFKLVYEKVDTQVKDEPGTVTRVESTCPELPEVEKTEENIDVDSYINIIKLPREQVEISKTSKVSDNTVDQTSSIMSAAAKVDLDQAAEATYDDKDEEKE